VCECSATSFVQVSCASGESSLSPLIRASCNSFEIPSTSSLSMALIVLSTKRLNETSGSVDYNLSISGSTEMKTSDMPWKYARTSAIIFSASFDSSEAFNTPSSRGVT
jgi:hypothetical protein